MRVTFWARLPFAAQVIEERLRAVDGAEVTVVRSLPDLLAALPGTRFLVLIDAPVEQARAVIERLAAPGNTVGALHFNSAGREGFEAAGIPGGIVVTNAEGALAPTVAEHAMALALALGRRLPEALAAQGRMEWDQGIAAGMRSLEGGTLLLVGLGHIGRAVAARARAFGMKVVAATRRPRADPLAEEVHGLAAVPDLAARADLIVTCIALSPETRGIIGRAALAGCRPGVLLVNVGRGGLVDTDALIEALATGRVAGAGLDVTDPEPLPPGHPLWGAPNLIVTSHVAGAGRRGEERIAEAAVESLRRFMAGL
jgi:phosphoglycerate dehydrogenase-like enzyme